MNTIELKKNFHLLIDSIDNEELLIGIYNLMKKRYDAREGHLWEKLTNSEQDQLLRTLEESQKAENLISHQDVRNKYKKWL